MDAPAQEIVPFRPSHRAVATFDDWERYLPAIEALANGVARKDVAAMLGLEPARLNGVLRAHPELVAEMKGFREALREMNQLRGQVLLEKRLEVAMEAPADTERMSNRDLTDILRATKPYDDGQAARVTIKFDVPL